MRSLICLVGQAVVFEEGSELIKALMGLDVGSSQLQRVCLHYGSQIDPLIKSNCESIIPRLVSNVEQDSVYVMMDGSMVFTTDHEWRELKLGRLYYDHQVIDIHKKRREVLHSVYVGHLGSVDDFFPKLERHLVDYLNKVIIGDGAKWIWNWADDNYPGATQILDFYHAKEKLVLFATLHLYHRPYKTPDFRICLHGEHKMNGIQV